MEPNYPTDDRTLKGTELPSQDNTPRSIYKGIRWGAFMLSGPEEFAWYLGAVYNGHTLTRKSDHWLLVIRASVGGSAKVAFFSARDPAGCFRVLALTVLYQTVEWKTDKYR